VLLLLKLGEVFCKWCTRRARGPDQSQTVLNAVLRLDRVMQEARGVALLLKLEGDAAKKWCTQAHTCGPVRVTQTMMDAVL
jgi:hypothetical protein